MMSRTFALACAVICLLTEAYGLTDQVSRPGEDFALIFDPEILEDNVSQVIETSRRLPSDQQFEFLRRWVFPKGTNTLIRWSIGYLPVDPAPVDPAVVSSFDHVLQQNVENSSGGAGRGRRAIIAPVLELIQVATTDQLTLLISQTLQLNPVTDEQRKQKSAFLAICYLKSQQLQLAEEQLRSFIDLARTAPGSLPEPNVELAVLIHIAEELSIRELATELSVALLDDVRSERFHRSERWKHHISGLKFFLDSNLPALQRGIAATSDSPTFQSWISVSGSSAQSRGRGFPVSMWVASPGSIRHVSGNHNHDYVYYVSPLTGNFSVEADTTTFDLRDIHLAYGNIWSGSAWDGRSAVVGAFRYDLPNIPLDPPLTRMFDTMRVRMSITDETRRTFVNSRLVHQNALPTDHDPWLAIHSWWLTNGSVRNLRITGTPVIPETINLITPNLDGWTSYYHETVGSNNAFWTARSFESETERSPLEIYGARRTDVPESFRESLLRYHRPIFEDGTIEYDFFYQAHQSITYPAIDRLCLILRPDGVYTHWASDGQYDSAAIEPDNQTFDQQHQQHSGKLPLIDGNWNHAEFSVRTKVEGTHELQFVDLKLNGELVYSQPLAEPNDRTFGLFHWVDQSEVRVRNLRWTGSWPKAVPELAHQELADLTLDRELGDREQLREYLDYNFGRGIETGTLSVRGADWESNAMQKPDGLRLKRSGGEYTNYLIATPMALSGDFDVIAEFEDLDIEAHPGGEGNIQLNLIVDDDRSSEYVLYRKYYVLENGTQEEILHASLAQKRGSEFQYTFFGAPAEESISGRLRMVRRGTTIFFLYAEQDSPHYRLVHREPITQDEVRVRLVNGHHKAGFTTVTWKSLNIRAESATGSLASPLKTIAELNHERDSLPARQIWDFRTADTQSVWRNALTLFGDNGTFTDGSEGLEISVPGSDEWKAAGLTSRQQIIGDFDISLAVEVLHIEPCLPHNESCILLLTEIPDTKKSTIETKFAIHSEGDTKAETQIRRLRKDGEFDYQELVSQTSKSPSLLRLARRGSTIYQIYQGTEHSEPQVLGAVELGPEPVSPGYLRALIHTGGSNRKTIARFITLDVRASEIQ